MSSYIKLSLEGIFVLVLTVCLYKYFRKKDSHDLSSRKWQIIIGVIYGLIAIGATEFGAPINGAIMNIRDAAPLCAGLFFGAPAGIIAGVIGGVERWLCVLWGGGTFTRLACTLGTIVAGLFGAFIKKYILEERTPAWTYAAVIGATAEVFHMLMVFLTNTSEVALSMQVMYTCAPIMIPLVAIIVALPAFIIDILDGENFGLDREKRKIAQDIQLWLMISVAFTFALTNGFEVVTQTHLADTTADNAIIQTLQDAQLDAVRSGCKGEELGEFLADDVQNWHIGTTGYLNVFDEDGNLVGKTLGNNILEFTDGEDQIPIFNNSEELTTSRQTGGGYERYQAYFYYDGYYVVGYYPVAEAELGKDFSVLITAFLEIVILAVLFLEIYMLIRRKVVKKLEKVNEDLANISSGNLDTIVNVRSNFEFVSLSDDINFTVDTLKHYIKEAEDRIAAELKLAHDIQYSALPSVYPDSDKYDLYGNMLAAKSVGGDFYDFYPLGEDRVAFMIADVSGKGIPAALFMMKTKTLVKGLVEAGHSPASAFTLANEELCNGNTAEMFVTAWLGILDINTGDVVYANAGHNNPIIGHCSNGTGEYLLTKHGMVLAGLEGFEYKEDTIHLAPGDIIFLYTDGVSEANNLNNELYGDDRLLKSFVDTNAVNMRYTCKVVKKDLDDFAGAAPQFDDITMLAIKMAPDDEKSDAIDLIPNEETTALVEAFVEKFCEDKNLSTKTFRKIMVIIDEIVSNIVYYSGASKCSVKLVTRRDIVTMTIKDDGAYYNPLEKDDPDVTLTAEERKIGGLGIFMVKEMAEDVKYGRINGNNVLDIVLKG